jgi:hypothetical protein
VTDGFAGEEKWWLGDAVRDGDPTGALVIAVDCVLEVFTTDLARQLEESRSRD